tara:strand:- start:3839 stop:5104 length:1266 start_codon:yes stop_codon:yes gene_type:complete
MNNKKNKHDLNNGKINCCQICSSQELKKIIDFGHQAPCDSLIWPEQLNKPETRYPLNLIRCQNCGLVQLDHVVDHKELFFAEYPYRSGITSTLANNLRATASTIVKRYRLPKGGLAVDLGSNDGTLLEGFQNEKMKVLGIEPTNIANLANGKGIKTIQKFFDDALVPRIIKEYGKAEVITACNMFAHVSKLGSLIKGAENLLVENGLFVTESHYLLDLLDTVQYDSIYHEHLKYYSVKSILKLFDFYNFTVIDIEKIPNYGGSIRVYARKGKSHQVSENVDFLLKNEIERGLYKDKIYLEFENKVKKSKLQLQNLIIEAQNKNQKIVGVGCPGRATTLLSYCNLDKDSLNYIAEQSTSLKLGLYTPGTYIPIVDEKIMIEEQPDFAIILSWHYWEPIVKNLREKGLRSKIIIPLPEVRMID